MYVTVTWPKGLVHDQALTLNGKVFKLEPNATSFSFDADVATICTVEVGGRKTVFRVGDQRDNPKHISYSALTRPPKPKPEPKPEAPKAPEPKVQVPKPEAPKVQVPKPMVSEAPKNP